MQGIGNSESWPSHSSEEMETDETGSNDALAIYQSTSNNSGQPSTSLNGEILKDSSEIEEVLSTSKNADDLKIDSDDDSSASNLQGLDDSFEMPDSPVYDSDGELMAPMDIIRKRNKERIIAMMNNFRDPEMEAQMSKTNNNFIFGCTEPKPVKGKQKKKRGGDDCAVRFNVRKPLELRRSRRLQSQSPDVTNIDFDETSKDSDDWDLESLEKVIYLPKKSRQFKRTEGDLYNKYLVPVEDVTEEMLNNIPTRVAKKVYSSVHGTSCHQCRQKTIDQKTSCRNPECVGYRGMFCGICLKNRYGEDCAKALLDPNWICPVCRGRCNCSVCRNRKGKRPTGILAPIAIESGFRSVDHMLEDLRGQGDKPEQDEYWALMRNPEAFLGFSDGGYTAHFQGGRVEYMSCNLCSALNNPVILKDDPEVFLGFSDRGHRAHFQDGRVEIISCNLCSSMNELVEFEKNPETFPKFSDGGCKPQLQDSVESMSCNDLVRKTEGSEHLLLIGSDGLMTNMDSEAFEQRWCSAQKILEADSQ
ncbi:cell division cycle-associated 7-like protein [Euwallacea similis]|uniref:cell division cycle-associated 7-like protein n=1 Tax=Euwallacea similis TaxID=1736056 RepID=UPI0034508976